MPMVTLFCDASVCNETGAAGWGAWAKRDDWVSGRLFGDTFKGKMNGSSDAEIAAIANAMVHCLNNGLIPQCCTVMIQSDSLRALGVLATHLDHTEIRNHSEAAEVTKFKSSELSQVEQLAVAKLKELYEASFNRLLLRHVKGHKSGGGRQWVNQQCDKIAFTHMDRARRALSPTQLISKRARRLQRVQG